MIIHTLAYDYTDLGRTRKQATTLLRFPSEHVVSWYATSKDQTMVLLSTNVIYRIDVALDVFDSMMLLACQYVVCYTHDSKEPFKRLPNPVYYEPQSNPANTVKMYRAVVRYDVDDTFHTVIAESDVWPTEKQAFDDLLEQVDYIVFEKFSIRQSEGEPNPYMDESDVQECAEVIYANQENPTDDDRLAYENVAAFRKWILNGFMTVGLTKEEYEMTNPFEGYIEAVQIRLT